MLSNRLDIFGYTTVNVSVLGKSKILKISRVVAQSFIPNPKKYPVVNHKNGIKQDNRVENLEWCTYSYNTIHAIENGLITFKKGDNHHKTTIDFNKIQEIRETFKNNKKINKKEFCKNLGVTRQWLWRVLTNKVRISD